MGGTRLGVQELLNDLMSHGGLVSLLVFFTFVVVGILFFAAVAWLQASEFLSLDIQKAAKYSCFVQAQTETPCGSMWIFVPCCYLEGASKTESLVG